MHKYLHHVDKNDVFFVLGRMVSKCLEAELYKHFLFSHFVPHIVPRKFQNDLKSNVLSTKSTNQNLLKKFTNLHPLD